MFEQSLKVTLVNRGTGILIIASEQETIDLTIKTLDEMRFCLKNGNDITPFYLKEVLGQTGDRPAAKLGKPIFRNRYGQPIQPKTAGQLAIVDAVRKNDIVFVNGPAGTGKTFLAVTLAVAALENRDVERLSLVRPAVEAGENLGYLPGDLKEKIAPYLHPIYDTIEELLPKEKVRAYNESNMLEIAPLAYMRGRTLKRTFIILDEAQNTTISQMKMFLTRIGPNSTAIITGDSTQKDLAPNQLSGFPHALSILKGIPGIAQVTLDTKDIQRHRLVSKIINAYEKQEH